MIKPGKKVGPQRQSERPSEDWRGCDTRQST